MGLSVQFSRAVRRYGGATPAQQEAIHDIERIIPALLARAFANGFRPAVGGICKTVDRLTGIPWTTRCPGGACPRRSGPRLAGGVWPRTTEPPCLPEILARSHNAFVTHYVRPQIYLMAVKVRDARGAVLDVVPAYPDADPGYHTALSLMDVLDFIQG